MLEEAEKKTNWFLWSIGGSCALVLFVSFYSFYYKKNYTFVVEVGCYPEAETCFQRDCSNPDDCPPNGLSNFKRYSLNAADFEMCKNEDCTMACATKKIKCTPVECTENLDAGESCS